MMLKTSWPLIGLFLCGFHASSAGAADNAFTINVRPLPNAAAKLASLHEGIVVAASYYGLPVPGGRIKGDEMGQVELGREEVRLTGSGGMVRFSGRSIRQSLVPFIKQRQVIANVNTYSARLSGPNNILDCGLAEEPIADLQRRTVEIKCKLIGEP